MYFSPTVHILLSLSSFSSSWLIRGFRPLDRGMSAILIFEYLLILESALGDLRHLGHHVVDCATLP